MPKTATPRKPEAVSSKLAETRAKSKNRSLSSLLGIGDNEKRLVTDFGSGLNDVIGRGTIAGLLGLPGDLGGAAENGLRSLLGLPQVVPYGGSEHIGQKMEQAGLVSNVRRPKTELLASLISPAQAATAGYKAPQMARAGVKALDNLSAPRTMGRQQGAIENLWHGSPHTFDRFDLSKIGTGEGAQAYGHGAYLAESPEVAQGYRHALTYKAGEVPKIGNDEIGDFYNKVQDRANSLPPNQASAEYDKLAILEDLMGEASDPNLIIKNAEARGYSPETVDWFKREVADKYNAPGAMYQTRLAWPDAREATDPLSPDHFLHWDKPLSEQSPMVQEKLTPWLSQFDYVDDFDGYRQPFVDEYDTMGGIHDKLADRLIGKDVVQERMRDLGIPGIRYLDGGSRGAGAGSHNYVVFDDKLIDIVSRNGQPVGNLGKMVAPQDEALRVAQQNAAKPVEEGGLGLWPDNTPEERAAAMGFDTTAYHATRSSAQIDSFRPGAWGSTYLAASPNRAIDGAAAGATDLSHLYSGADGAEQSARAVMPLVVRGDDVATLRPSRKIWDGLPEVASGDDVDSLAKSVGGNYWWDVYDEVPVRSESGEVIGEKYIKKQYPDNQYTARSKPWQPSDNMLPGYNSGSDKGFLENVGKQGQGGFLVSDEAGASIVAGQNMPIRSRFAAFDPMRRDSSDLLAGIAPFGAVPWLRDEQP